MSGDPVSQAEFSRALEFLRDDIKTGFAGVRLDVSGVHTRLDTLNGQTRKHGESIVLLRRDVDDIRETTPAAVRAAAPSKKVVVGAIAGGSALAEFLYRLVAVRLGL